jgi:hypothetical protein
MSQLKKQVPGMKLVFHFLITLALTALNFGVWQNVWSRQEVLSPGSQGLAASLQLVLALTFVIDLIILLQVWQARILLPFRRLRRWLGWLRWLALIFIGVLLVWFYYFTPWSLNFYGTYIRLTFYLFSLGMMAWLAASGEEASFEWNGLMIASVILGGLFTFGATFRGLSAYPFGLYWSEGNRFYDYSLLFGQRLYRFPSGNPPTPLLSLGRQGLWGLYFLLPKVSIFGMRLWNGIIFSIPYVLLGWLCIKKRGQNQFAGWIFGLWAFLFLNQGPIYTPLILAAILVAWIRRLPLWIGCILMVISAFYASVSRETWLFAPAMWIVPISLLESAPLEARSLSGFFSALVKPQKHMDPKAQSAGLSTEKLVSRSWVEGWRRALVLGFCGLLGGYFLPLLSPQLRIFLPYGGSALSPEGVARLIERQPLLWERLWPNPTYSLGIIFGLLLAVAPLVTLILIFSARGRWRLDIWQILAMLLPAMAFMGVGIVVSVKIGGGSNLHNLDMLLIALLFIAGLAWDAGGLTWLTETRMLQVGTNLLVMLAIIIPSLPGMMQATYQQNPPETEVSNILSSIRQAVLEAKDRGEVLFIDQRQLLTFGTIQDVPLVAEFEKKRLMDEAMANNAPYFELFYKDLASHRFPLIVSEPLWVNFQEEQKGFSNENNSWVKWVSLPVLCYYQPLATYMDFGVQLLVPKEKAAPVPGVICPEN